MRVESFDHGKCDCKTGGRSLNRVVRPSKLKPQFGKHFEHRDQLPDADNDRHKGVDADVFGPDADHADRNGRRPVCKHQYTASPEIRPAALQPSIDNVREDRDQIKRIEPLPFGQEIIIQTVGRSPIAREQKDGEEKEDNSVSDDEKIVRQSPALQESEKPEFPPPERYHPNKQGKQPGSVRPAQAQKSSMSGNPLNHRAYTDENVRDAKTNNDRRKHHHMLELVRHFSSFMCGLLV